MRLTVWCKRAFSFYATLGFEVFFTINSDVKP